MNEDKGQRRANVRFLAIIVSIVVVVSVIILLIFYFMSGGQQQQAGEEVIDVNNFSDHVENIPDSERELIESVLRYTVDLNILSEGLGVHDAEIREGSYSQTYENGIFSTSFIIDIESLQQSYGVKNFYGDIEEDDYITLISCLPLSELKWGDFECKDRYSEENGLPRSNPIVYKLPIETSDYRAIFTRFNLDGKAEVLVEVYHEFTRNKAVIDTFVSNKVNEVREKLDAYGIDPNSYTIDFTVSFR
jgi:hypothetical protein